MSPLARGCVAEFCGTFALVFFGAGSILVTNPGVSGSAAGGLVTVALAHGLILSVFVTACMYVSGAQFNPAVSVALAAIGKQSPRQAGAFMASQFVAAACGAGMLVALLGPGVANSAALGTNVGATVGKLTADGNVLGVLGFEFLATFALMFSILMGTVDGRAHKLGGFVIGLTVTAMILAIGPLTGASMNPARTFGPLLYASEAHHGLWWAYFVAPVAGAIACALVYKAVWMEEVKR